MSLMNCPECGKQISDKAFSCPNCGFPVSNFNKAEQINDEKYDILITTILGNAAENYSTVQFVMKTKNVNLSKATSLLLHLPLLLFSNIRLKSAETVKNYLSSLNNQIEIRPSEISNATQDDYIISNYFNPIDNPISCPRCGSTAITSDQRGFNLLTGFIGSNKTVNRCGKCGWSWNP